MLFSNLGNISYSSFYASDPIYSTKPDEFIKTKWQTLKNERVHFIDLTCGSRYIVFAQKYTETYGSLVIISYGLESPKYMRLIDGVWNKTQLATIITGTSRVCISISNKPAYERNEYIGTSFFLPIGYNFSIIDAEVIGSTGNFASDLKSIRYGNYIRVSTENPNLAGLTVQLQVDIS